jgi:hypothetical protein
MNLYAIAYKVAYKGGTTSHLAYARANAHKHAALLLIEFIKDEPDGRDTLQRIDKLIVHELAEDVRGKAGLMEEGIWPIEHFNMAEFRGNIL